MLEENIALLQARIQELEDPNIAARKVYLHDPYKAFRAASMSGREGTAPGERMIVARPEESLTPIAGLELDDFELPDDLSVSILFLEANTDEFTRVELVLDHGAQLGLIVDAQHFKNTLHLPTTHPSRPHQSLVYAIYLHGIRLSKDPKLEHLEEVFLQRSILAIQDAISSVNVNDVCTF